MYHLTPCHLLSSTGSIWSLQLLVNLSFDYEFGRGIYAQAHPAPSSRSDLGVRQRACEAAAFAAPRQVADQTHGRMRLGPGTLYSSIQTLLEEKLIEEVGLRQDAKLGHERRRYYRLTSAGRKLARSEPERLADLLRVARAKNIFRGDYV